MRYSLSKASFLLRRPRWIKLLHIILVVVSPDALIPCDWFLLRHEVSDFASRWQVNRLAVSLVEVDPAEVIEIILADEILAELISPEEDGGVVLKVEVKEGNIVSVSVVLEQHGHFPEFKHDISMESEEDLRRDKLASFLDLLNHIFSLYVDVVQGSLCLEAQCEYSVGLYHIQRCEHFWINAFFADFLFLFIKTSRGDFEEVDVGGDRVLSKLLHQMRVLFGQYKGWGLIFQQVRDHYSSFLIFDSQAFLKDPINVLFLVFFRIRVC